MLLSVIYLLFCQILVARARISLEGRLAANNTFDECNQDILDKSIVTVCGLEYCEPASDSGQDQFSKTELNWPKSKNEVVHIVSNREKDRFKVSVHPALDTDENYYEESHVNVTMFAETTTKYQRILGFGTTLTDATCKNIDELPSELRDRLIREYFSPTEGIALNLIKLPIGSTRFSYTNYVLEQPVNPVPSDFVRQMESKSSDQPIELSPYDLDYRIPIIKDALKSAGKLKNRVKLLATASCAPGSMKQSGKMTGAGYLRADRYANYAKYLMDFVDAYKLHDLNIWSLVLAEQPATLAQEQQRQMSANTSDEVDFCSVAMKPSDMIKLIGALNKVQQDENSNKLLKFLILNDSRAFAPVWADAIFSQQQDHVAGLAYSCDKNHESDQSVARMMSSKHFAPYDNLAYVARRHPQKYLLATQSSSSSRVKLGNWQHGENYLTEIIKNLEFGSVGWIESNGALNLEGGPSLSSQKYRSDSSVIVDGPKQRYYRNPMFYAIGHVSRYVKPGSIRVKLAVSSSAHMHASQQIAFLTPDNYLVVIVSNNNIGPMPLSLGVNRRTKLQLLLDTKSFNTFLIKL